MKAIRVDFMAALALGGLLGIGCASTKLAPGADAIPITINPDLVKGCQFLGSVKSSVEGNAFQDMNAVDEAATGEIRNQALSIGANMILLSPVQAGTRGGALGGGRPWSTQHGEAYLCPDTSRVAAAPVPADCRWEVVIESGDWQPPQLHWCGDISITRVTSKAMAGDARGSIWIRNRSMTDNELTITISAVNDGDEEMGSTTWEHGIGDNTTDQKHFAIRGSKPTVPTKLLIAVVRHK
jgi:hypothetical protein